jgi:hypothetical protein
VGRFFLLLVGNVVPTSGHQYLVAHEVLGALVSLLAVFVVVQSIRERPQQRPPLPLILVTFAVLFDLMLSVSRFGLGTRAASLDRYSMPNVILLVGILIYAWGHVPSGQSLRQRLLQVRGASLGGGAFAVLLILQCILATQFGLSNGNTLNAFDMRIARVIVNFDRIPAAERGCYFQTVVVGPPLANLEYDLKLAATDRLSLFRPGADNAYLTDGPPDIPHCDLASHVVVR